MSTVAVSAHLAGLRAPAELAQLAGWLCWRYEQDEGDAKPRKVPYYPAGGRRRKGPEDRGQLTTFAAARAAACRRGMDGVGLALLPEWGLAVLDLDHCVGPDGVHPEALALVEGTLAEFSPSGTGVHAVFRAEGLANRKDSRGEPFGLEVFATAGYVTWTGNALPHVTGLELAGELVAPMPEDVRAYCARRFARGVEAVPADPLMTYAPALGLRESQLQDALDALDPDMAHAQWLAVGMALHHETAGERFDLWDEWSSNGQKYPGSEALRRRWDSFGQGSGGPVVTARTLVAMASREGARVLVPEVADNAEFDAVVPPASDRGPRDTTGKAPRFPLVPAEEFSQGAAPRWIIKGVLPQAELAVVYGEPGSGKTFAVLDLAMAVARGVSWRGCRVRRGRVIYVAAEGSGGLRKRLAAYAQHHGISLAEVDLLVVPAAPNLLLKEDALELARAIAACGPADLVVIDTLAQATPGGNENAAEDMGKALAHCKGIHRAVGALVLLVHHAGKDASKGARGWSGLRGAADCEFEVLRMGTARVIQARKQKDGEDGQQWAFDLEVLQVGMDEDGDPITSCAVVDAAVPTVQGPARALGPVERVVLEVVGEIAQSQTRGIEVEAVVAEVARRLPPPEEGKRDTRKQRARRALEQLCQGDGAPYWVGEDNCLEVM